MPWVKSWHSNALIGIKSTDECRVCVSEILQYGWQMDVTTKGPGFVRVEKQLQGIAGWQNESQKNLFGNVLSWIIILSISSHFQLPMEQFFGWISRPALRFLVMKNHFFFVACICNPKDNPFMKCLQFSVLPLLVPFYAFLGHPPVERGKLFFAEKSLNDKSRRLRVLFKCH